MSGKVDASGAGDPKETHAAGADRAPSNAASAKSTAPFRHEALFYSGAGDFANKVASFIAEGVGRGEPALVVVSAEKIEALRAALGGAPERVHFADMAEVGLNPARIIPAWREFVDANAGGGPFRGVGEPIWAARTPAELVECQRHESLLNVAFADTTGFWLACPYDTATLPDAVLDEAKRSHPFVAFADEHGPSESYSGLGRFSMPFDTPLAAPPPDAETLEFSIETLPAIRRAVRLKAEDAGLSRQRCDDAVFAANEIAANTVRHGGGRGVFRLWTEDGALVCEAKDSGRILNSMAGRERPPDALKPGGLGLWLANQLCDLVQIRTFDDGSVVRLRLGPHS
jgi:anti-sigma regulatory factor (Ser/Thr protein kinase)